MRMTELLEQRRLLAADVFVTGRGTLIVNGDEADNRVEIEFNDDRDTIRAAVYPVDSSDDDDDDDALASGEFDYNDVSRIGIFLFGGNDVAILNADGFDGYQRHVTIMGMDGDDRLSGDTNGPLLIDGGSGVDRLGEPAVLDYGGLRKNRDVLNRYFDDKAENGGDRDNGQDDTSSVSLAGGPGDDILYAGYNTTVDGGDDNDTGYIGVAIDEDRAVSASQLVGLSLDFYGRLASVNVDAFDAAIVGTSGDDGFFDEVDDFFGGEDADLDDDLFGSRTGIDDDVDDDDNVNDDANTDNVGGGVIIDDGLPDDGIDFDDDDGVLDDDLGDDIFN